MSEAETEEVLLEDIMTHFVELDNTPVAELETTLVVVPNMLLDFSTTTCSLIGLKP